MIRSLLSEWLQPVLGMMGLGMTMAIPKQASAGASPPSTDDLPHYTIIFP